MSKRTNNEIVSELTESLIAQIEAGTAPWLCPWSRDPMQLPRNARTGREYSGVNVLILWSTAIEREYHDSRWLTFKQALDLGGNVRRGEKGTRVAFWRFVTREEVRADGTKTEKRIPIARTYTVFNAEQCDGLDLEAPPALETFAHDDVAGADAARALARTVGAVVHEKGERAFYSRATDAITVPALERFRTPADFAATLVHELVHWTGAPSRCDREFGARFGDDAYAFEELVAEMGAAFACAHVGVRGELQHAEYLASWARVLRADRFALLTAARKAVEAVEYLLGRATDASAGEDAREATDAAA